MRNDDTHPSRDFEYIYKTFRVGRKGYKRVLRRQQKSDWLLHHSEEIKVGREFPRTLTIRKQKGSRCKPKAGLVWLTIALVSALAVSSAGLYAFGDSIWGLHAEAKAAAQILRDGDLISLEKHLAEQRGQKDFAYFFASEVTPRDLGDALATVSSLADDEHVDPDRADEYDLLLTDLSGVLALATHGTGDRALESTWTDDFILATTTPEHLYGKDSGDHDSLRVSQDIANRANLLLLLARGYWSVDFLKSVTREYHGFVLANGGNAWPTDDAVNTKMLAAAPNGTYLTDGILALTAALVTNPSASEWAFTDFLPGTMPVEGTDYKVGKFTHFLMFEYLFAQNLSEESSGYGVALTALSAAMISANLNLTTAENPASPAEQNSEIGPSHDAQVIQTLALELKKKQERVCTISPSNWGSCIVNLAEAIWSLVTRWGRFVLEILTFATILPFPFGAIGVAAATANATWYALESDFGMAGLSLATAAPGLAFVKISKWARSGTTTANSAKSAVELEKSAEQAAKVAQTAKWWRPIPAWKDCPLAASSGGIVIKYGSDWNRKQKRAADEKVLALHLAAERGELAKTQVTRSSKSASSTYRKETGKDVPIGSDIDHTIELQLGGNDDIKNMKPLDKTVNSSFGAQISNHLRALPLGTPIPAVAICK